MGAREEFYFSVAYVKWICPARFQGMSICNPVLYSRSEVLALQAYGCESEHPRLLPEGSGVPKVMGLPWGEGKESPWWDLSRASTGSAFCPDCAE